MSKERSTSWNAFTLTTAYVFPPMSLVTTGTTPHFVQMWNWAVFVPKTYRDDSDHAEPIYENLAAGLRATGANQLWVADITYIRLRSGFVYLAVLLDAWSRRVVGYAVGNTLAVQLTLTALNAAVANRRPPPGLIHHSDRGAQYAAKPYRDRLAALCIRGSMSRKANPYDNATAESFMKTLKHEEVLALDYDTIDDVSKRLPRFIDEIYNARRLHSALSYMPPMEFELHNAR